MFSELCRHPEPPRSPATRPVSVPHRPRLLHLGALLVAATAATATGSIAAAAPLAAPPEQAEPWDGRFFISAPAELLAAATAASATDDGRPVAMLFDETRYSFDEAGRLTTTTRTVYRIRSANAHPRWSVFGAGWRPWHHQRPRLRARVVTPDGQEHRLDPKVLEQSTAGGGDPEVFDEVQVLRGPLPAIGPGAVVEEEASVPTRHRSSSAAPCRGYGSA